jgi:hypothetical protein
LLQDLPLVAVSDDVVSDFVKQSDALLAPLFEVLPSGHKYMPYLVLDNSLVTLDHLFLHPFSTSPISHVTEHFAPFSTPVQ